MRRTLVAVDTSLAVVLLVKNHPDHGAVSAWAAGRRLALCGHALAETYAVLTRLPGDARVTPADAVRLIDDRFSARAMNPAEHGELIHRELAGRGVAGGATYDGLVALAARAHGLALATRDARARTTYEALGARVELVAAP